jgi:hypothetical protein
METRPGKIDHRGGVGGDRRIVATAVLCRSTLGIEAQLFDAPQRSGAATTFRRTSVAENRRFFDGFGVCCSAAFESRFDFRYEERKQNSRVLANPAELLSLAWSLSAWT